VLAGVTRALQAGHEDLLRDEDPVDLREILVDVMTALREVDGDSCLLCGAAFANRAGIARHCWCAHAHRSRRRPVEG